MSKLKFGKVEWFTQSDSKESQFFITASNFWNSNFWDIKILSESNYLSLHLYKTEQKPGVETTVSLINSFFLLLQLTKERFKKEKRKRGKEESRKGTMECTFLVWNISFVCLHPVLSLLPPSNMIQLRQKSVKCSLNSMENK